MAIVVAVWRNVSVCFGVSRRRRTVMAGWLVFLSCASVTGWALCASFASNVVVCALSFVPLGLRSCGCDRARVARVVVWGGGGDVCDRSSVVGVIVYGGGVPGSFGGRHGFCLETTVKIIYFSSKQRTDRSRMSYRGLLAPAPVKGLRQ